MNFLFYFIYFEIILQGLFLFLCKIILIKIYVKDFDFDLVTEFCF
jgi:hypothetical protein